jgi:hypothetical protein
MEDKKNAPTESKVLQVLRRVKNDLMNARVTGITACILNPVRGETKKMRKMRIISISSVILLCTSIFVMFSLHAYGDPYDVPYVGVPVLSSKITEKSIVPSKSIYKRRATPDQCRNAMSNKFADPAGSEKARVSTADAKAFALGGYKKIAQGSGKVDLYGIMTLVLAQIQHISGLYGSVGEMGVHHGRYTGCLFLGTTLNEDLVVGDVFEQQEKNVDGSGNGNKGKFMKGLTTYGLSKSDLHTVHTGSTDEIPFDWSSQAGFSPFRMVSVDAGHTAVLTFNDLEISFCNLLQGGIVVLDDWFHGYWMGVTEGGIDFFSMGGHDVFPFLHCEGKFFMTNTREHHDMYYNELIKDKRIKKFLRKDAKKFGGSNENVLNDVPFLFCTRESLPKGEKVEEIWASLVM